MKFGGLELPRDALIAPGRAFARMAASPEWFPAYAVVTLLGIASLALMVPALDHAWRIEILAASGSKSLSAANLNATVQASFAQAALSQTAAPPIAWALSAMVLWVFSRGEAAEPRFRAYFSLLANASIPSAVGGLATALAVHARDPASFTSLAQVATAFPDTLAAFVPHGKPRELLFLSSFGIFDFWTMLLIGYGFAALAKVRLILALAVSFGIGFTSALLSALTAQ